MAHPRSQGVKSRHAFAEWPGKQAPPLRGAFLPDLDRIPGYSHEGRAALPGRAFVDHFQGEDGRRVSVRVSRHATAADAQEALVEVLLMAMAIQVPRCEERGLELGDPCFCGSGEPIAFAAFARANILIRVDSTGEEAVSVAPVAAELDRQLAAALERE